MSQDTLLAVIDLSIGMLLKKCLAAKYEFVLQYSMILLNEWHQSVLQPGYCCLAGGRSYFNSRHLAHAVGTVFSVE